MLGYLMQLQILALVIQISWCPRLITVFTNIYIIASNATCGSD